MISRSRKHSMRRLQRGYLFLILVFVLTTWWIYSKCFNYIEFRKMDTNLRVKEIIKTKMEKMSINVQENEIYPVHKKFARPYVQSKESQRLEGHKYEKKFNEELVDMNIEKDERSKEEVISNDLEGDEIYPLDIQYMPARIERRLKKNLLQLYEENQKYIKVLKEILQDTESFQDIEFEDDFLGSFISGSDYKIDEAFTKIHNFLDLRISHDYFFHNINFDFTQNPAYRFVTVLPYRGPDGSVVIFFEVGKWDPDKVPLIHLKQMLFIIATQTVRHPLTQASGVHIICDFKNAGFQHLKYCTPQNIYLLQHVSFKCMPPKRLGFHFLNVNFMGSTVLSLIRPFLSEEFERIFYIHVSLEELHNFFPRSMLPAKYGGNLTEYYSADWIWKANQQHGDYPVEGQKNVF